MTAFRFRRTNREVVDAGTVTGDADAIVHIRSRDIASLEDALESVRVAPTSTTPAARSSSRA